AYGIWACTALLPRSNSAGSLPIRLLVNWVGFVARRSMGEAQTRRSVGGTRSTRSSGRVCLRFPRGKTDGCPIGLTEAMELWLGPGPQGSAFRSREELLAAWQRGRDYVMRLWGSHGRRPQIWWALETDLPYPGYAHERSFLWRAGVLSEAERTELEVGWRAEFNAACRMGAREAREHFEHHDFPAELVAAWEAERKVVRRR